MASEAIETKLAAARTRLVLDQPFLGALVLRLPLVVADPKWCRTTATDARKLYYNSAYVEALSLDATQFVLAHEALHCALSHFARRHHRLKHRWDIACDYAINPLLIQEGLSPPPGALVEEHFKGMTAEEIYPCLDDNSDEQDTLDEHIYDREQADIGTRDQERRGQGDNATRSRQDAIPGNQNRRLSDGDPESRGVPQPPPLTSQEQQTLSVQWQQRLAGAAQQAMQAGKLGATMSRMVDFLLQPQLPWRMLLARYLTATARDDYSYTRPSSRRGDPAIFPSLRSAQINLAVAVDISGSVSEKEISEFLAEIDALRGQLRARITLLACDATLSRDGPWLFEPWEDLELPRELHGGGGTSFVPVFKWVASQDTAPELLIYFTDAQGVFPHGPPSYPVFWLVKGKAKVPWGQRIQLN
jgi:predicted metal-dependent peptidase